MILDVALEEMAGQIGNPLAIKGVMLRQSLVFWSELDQGESLPEGLFFLWDSGCDGDGFIAQLAGTSGGEPWGVLPLHPLGGCCPCPCDGLPQDRGEQDSTKHTGRTGWSYQ